MNVWRSEICALLLALAMMPGALEIIESAAHLVTEGHWAHAASTDDRHEPSGPEHGCTPIFHFCGCHASLAFLGPQSPPVIRLHASRYREALAPDPLLAGFWPAIERPPRA
jgi:hypothetical protein